MANESLKNCPVIIYDEKHDYIAKAIISDHDKRNMTISVANELAGVKQGARLSLLVIQPGGVSEINGIAQVMHHGTREILICHEHQREARASVRHKLNAQAVIRNIIVDSVQKPLPSPLGIIVENISSTGVLISCIPGFFGVGSIVGIELNFNGKNTMLFAMVVREKVNENFTFSYGCKLIFLKK